MSESDDLDTDLEELREKKREELQQSGETGDAETNGSTPGEPVHVESSDHFQRLVAENDVVLVDYWAEWCGPCKMLEPTIETIASTTDALVAKVDIDDHQGLARDSNIRGVPTLVVYADGHPVERLVGVQDESRIRQVVEANGG